MKNGNWVPISKLFVNDLPKDRPYTKIEATYCLQVDYDNGKTGSIAAYAGLWCWSRRRVRKLFNELGIRIDYPEDTRRKQNQSGQIAIQISDRSARKKGQIRLIDSKDLQGKADRSREKRGQKADRSRSTPRYPDPNKEYIRRLEAKNDGKNDDLEIAHAMVQIYHKELPSLAQVRKLTEKRVRWALARWSERHENQEGLRSDTPEYWKAYFRFVAQSEFLTGRNSNPWKADFEWLVNRDNHLKVIEGRYHK